MRKLLNLVKWAAILGREPQTFLGAKWVTLFLSKTPESKRRIWALRFLSLSPHYFLSPDDPKYKGLSNDEYLERAFQDLVDSRVKIFEHILKPHVSSNDVVLDYGCGPGTLAKITARYVKKVYGCDISTGALECAKILSNGENLEYFIANKDGFEKIGDESLDVIYSFAMVQHVTDEVLDIVLDNCRKKLKRGGRLVIHLQLQDNHWRTEDDWLNDSSIKGKLKFKYGLQCFGRTKDVYAEKVKRHGFGNVKFENIADLTPDHFDGISSQKLLTATRSS